MASTREPETIVCSACLTEACWQGVLMCEDARRASITLIRAADHPGRTITR